MTDITKSKYEYLTTAVWL